MADEKTSVLDGLVVTREGKPAAAPEAGATYAVRPAAGGQMVKANGPEVIGRLRAAFPGAHFLWLSKPAAAAAAKPQGGDKGDKGGK